MQASMNELTRTFIAIKPPPDIQQALGETQMLIRRKAGSETARWTPPHELIYTLCPLGELPASSLARIPPMIAPVFASFGPLYLTVEGIGGSPSPTQPRIVWAGIGGDIEAQARLYQALEQAIAPLGLNREVHKFMGHIVLGRLRTESESARSDLGRSIRMTPIGTLGMWTALEVDLMKADIGPLGPTMVTMQSFPLLG